MLRAAQSSTDHPSTEGVPSLDISSDRWALEGPITFESVAVLETTLDRASQSPTEVSWQKTTHVDSSAVAFLIAIKRRHPGARFTDVPEPLLQLAEVYGVRDLVV